MSYIDVLFSGGLSDIAAWTVVVSVFSIELFMNLRNGEGLISNAHFAVVGPLWLIAIALIAIAIFRKPWRTSRETTKMSEHQ